jgi:high-affinity iron transporter
MVATFVIFLREGIEASMIIAILLAALDRMGQRRHYRDVYLGVAAALVVVTVAGVVVYFTVRTYAGTRGQTIFETVTYLMAAAILTYMTFWMRSHAATISSELRTKAQAALDGKARWGLGLLSFQAVGREGLETMVFTLAIVFATSAHQVLWGAALGLALSLVIAYAMYHLGKRLNVAVFFKVLGLVLLVFAAGLLVDAVENLQELGWLPVLTEQLWHTGRYLSQDSALGDIFHAFFGYAQSPTAGQLLIYAAYLGITVTWFVRMPVRRPPAAVTSAGAEGAGGSGGGPAPQEPVSA